MVCFLCRKEAFKPMKIHEQVEQYILDKIRNHELVPGDQIPTENELALLFHTTRPTVRQASNHLTSTGQLVRHKGKGSFVTQPKVLHESTSFVAGYRKECEKKHQTLITKVLALEVIKADPLVQSKLGLTSHDRVIRLTRVRFLDTTTEHRPVVYTTVYVPYKSNEFLLNIPFEEASFYESMEAHGNKITHASRCLEVALPPDEVHCALKLGAFEPTILITSVGKTATDNIVEYSVSYYPATSSQFLIEVHQ